MTNMFKTKKQNSLLCCLYCFNFEHIQHIIICYADFEEILASLVRKRTVQG